VRLLKRRGHAIRAVQDELHPRAAARIRKVTARVGLVDGCSANDSHPLTRANGPLGFVGGPPIEANGSIGFVNEAIVKPRASIGLTIDAIVEEGASVGLTIDTIVKAKASIGLTIDAIV
jgi:hypothetical protein